MKTNKEVENICKEFTFYDHYKIKSYRIKHLRECVINVLSASDFKHQDNRIKIIDGDVKNIEHEISNLRIAVLKMLCKKKNYMHQKLGMKI